MTNTVKTYTLQGMKEFQIGDKVFVGFSSSARQVFGENGELTKITKNHLVFTTESGTIIKTKIDNLNEVIGKASKKGYFVSPQPREEGNFYKRNIKF